MEDLYKWNYSRRLAESWTVEQAEDWTEKHDDGDYDFITDISSIGMQLVPCLYV